jgi:hypothetical protein
MHGLAGSRDAALIEYESNIDILISHGRAVLDYVSGVQSSKYTSTPTPCMRRKLEVAMTVETVGIMRSFFSSTFIPGIIHAVHPGSPTYSIHSSAIFTDVSGLEAWCLRAIVLAEADSTLTVEAVGPEAGKLDIRLTHLGVGDQEPGTEDTLGKDIQDSVSDDLAVNTNDAGTVGKTPDTSWC